MARYLLGTSSLIDFSNGREPARSRLLGMAQTGDEIGVCAVVVAEFVAGLPPAERVSWRRFFQSVNYWDISRDAAERAGANRFTFARQGRAIDTADALIAAVAVERRAMLVTANVKDFPMPDVVLLPLIASR